MKVDKVLTEKEMKKFYGKFYKASPKVELFIDPEIGDEEVPEELWPLAPYAEFWGISDDGYRSDLVEQAPTEVKKNLKAVVTAFENDLEGWLAGPAAEDPYPSDAFVAFAAMMMAADEI